MARSRAGRKGKTSPLAWLRDNAIVRYLRETRAELHKVHWPTRQEAEDLTKLVFAVTVSMAIFMGLLDYLFSKELQGLITGNAIAIGVAVIAAVMSIVTVVILKRQVV